LFASMANAQHKDRLELRPYKPGFFDKDIMTGIEKFQEIQELKKPKPGLKVDIAAYGWVPKSTDEFKTVLVLGIGHGGKQRNRKDDCGRS